VKADDVQPGDRFEKDGETVYEVIKSWREEGDGVYAHVRFRLDGGSGIRSWDFGQDVPLVRS
jgi:hypothetical protein